MTKRPSTNDVTNGGSPDKADMLLVLDCSFFPCSLEDPALVAALDCSFSPCSLDDPAPAAAAAAAADCMSLGMPTTFVLLLVLLDGAGTFKLLGFAGTIGAAARLRLLPPIAVDDKRRKREERLVALHSSLHGHARDLRDFR